MKLWISILGLLLSLTVQANDAAFKKMQQMVVNMGPGCNVRIKIPEAAKFSVRYSKNSGEGGAGLVLENPFSLKTKKYIEPFYFGFTCYVDSKKLYAGEPVRYNEKTKKWEHDIYNRFESWYSEKSKKALDQATDFYELSAIKESGYAFTEIATFGDAKGRRKILNYSLFNPPKALCGEGEMGDPTEGKKRDLTPYALQILRSIEFIDDVPPEQVPMSPDADIRNS